MQVNFEVVILAAGMGTRLARSHPKPLTRLADGRTILQQQLQNLRTAFGEDVRITLVVGYKLELILEHVPDVAFVYNEIFDQTNTSKSLLKALRGTGENGVLWMNGDVVFDPAILDQVSERIRLDQSLITANVARVDEEEVKYRLTPEGYVSALSKEVPLDMAVGEAIGINFISAADKPSLIRRLEQARDDDFFERAMELTIDKDDIRYAAVDICDHYAIEIDTQIDLDRANAQLITR